LIQVEATPGPSIRQAVRLLQQAIREQPMKQEAQEPENEFLSKRVVVRGQKYKRLADGTTVVQASEETNTEQETSERLFFGGASTCEYCDLVFCWLDNC